MILVDTNVLSETSRRDGNIVVLDWIARHAHELHIPVFVVAELRFGCERLENSRSRNRLERWLADLLSFYHDRIVPFEQADADLHGRVRARLQQMGRPASAPDSYIAAMGLARKCPVATRNDTDFAPSGVEIVNPWKD
ncbi:MAG: PIN domain-containing protein [Pseudomonadota bacterium]